jgi:hypothetical protein
MNIHVPKLVLMLDVETLATTTSAVVWQSALYGIDSSDPTTLLDFPSHQYLPIQPQLDLLPARQIQADTLLFWMKPENAEARELMATECDSPDFDELSAVLRHFNRALERYIDQSGGDYELWTRGQFDLPIMQSLLTQAGLPILWDFRKTRDLRTLESVSGVSYRDVPQPQGFIKHRADWDAIFQLSHWAACMKALGADKA